MKEKDEILRKLKEKIENLVKKNTALDKDNYRLKLAFKESMVEKEEFRKENTSQNETINEILKKNSTLNEELKVKSEMLELLREQVKGDQSTSQSTIPTEKEKESHKETENEEEDEDEVQEVPVDDVDDDRAKCNDCDFKTRVRKYMKSHQMAHDRGQYQCQRGCKESFKSWSKLDEHHKDKHPVTKQIQFICNVCNFIATSKHLLTQHIVNKHKPQNIQVPNVNCEVCGYSTNNHQDMVTHKRGCNSEFIRVGNKICKYFATVGCFKGQSCRFKHPEENQRRDTPSCRNGIQCRYLANGVCSFFHRGVGVQNPRQQSQQSSYQASPPKESRQWCKFLEDCVRVPNCAFIHYEEDFPQLRKTNDPPIGKRNRARGQY